ncbi:MAG: hypothetical protein IJ880_03805 [Bacilli bacterium]|nr:hypothetical protein [Bacilli bacterium]MBR3119812.1 hypothetical protein [Oceanobacillus sp.]
MDNNIEDLYNYHEVIYYYEDLLLESSHKRDTLINKRILSKLDEWYVYFNELYSIE